MIVLENDSLVFSFPEVHSEAKLSVDFQRTLRIPDDDRGYPLPPGLGSFPLRHVDDFAVRVPDKWLERGGVMLPMYQAEALWLNFSSGGWWGFGDYPFAVKIATGKVNAVSGEGWKDGLNRDPQDYLVAPNQPWLDGYCVEKGVIRQFVAMPLGEGYSAEEQLTGAAEYGGLQIIAYPMKAVAYERYFGGREQIAYEAVMSAPGIYRQRAEMGLAPGGRMRQKIYDDRYRLEDWDFRHSSRCFVHIANSVVWREITGQAPPTRPPTAKQYTQAGLPWFDLYDADRAAVEGAEELAGLNSVKAKGEGKGESPLPENESVDPGHVKMLRQGLREGQVREWTAG